MRPRLLSLARQFSGSSEQADDVAQEALLRLWLLRHRVADEQQAEALCVRMAKNICVSEWRRRKTATSTAATPVLAEEMQPLATEENTRMLQLAIGTLPPQEQRLFRMRQELQMDIGQIAATTGLLPRSVSAIVSVARKKIITQLKKGGIL